MEKSKTISKKVISLVLSLLMVLSCFSGLGLTAYAADTTVTWSAADIKTATSNTVTKDGVTLAAGYIDGVPIIKNGGTFTTTLGNFTKIEISADYTGRLSGTGWSSALQSATWTGNAASVSFSGEIWGGRMTCDGDKLTIKFTISAGSVDKTALNNAITVAETLYDSIKDVADYLDIAATLSTAIEDAKDVADSDTADQNAVDAATTAITTAKTNAEAAKKDVDDTTEANKVSDKISELPSKEEVTKNDKTAIDAAKAAFDALTDDQKEKVSDADKQKLNDAVEALAAIEKEEADTAAAKAVSDTINALPASDKVATTDKAAIEAARKAYDALSADQKKKVSADTLKKLTDAESALAVAEVNAAIDALPAADEVTTANKDAIEAARKAYDALTDEEKEKIAPETLKKLTDAESALAVAEVNAAIDALPAADEVTTANKDAIEAARKAYDALTEEEKEKIAPETLKKLTDAESAFSVASVKEKINALPAADEVTTANKDAIEAARAFYDALTDEEKAKVAPETLKKLTDAEDALAAATVSDEIKALPAAAEVTTDNKAAIEVARKAYDALTDEQKAYVSAETLKKLTDAESALAVAEANKAISELPEADKVTLADKDAIEAARKAYDALTDEEKAKIAPETLEKLTNAEKAYAAAKEADDTAKAKDASDKIAALPKAADVTTKDEKAIKAARAAYDALSDDQKAKVPAEILKKLTDDEAALAEAEKQEKLAAEVEAAKENAQEAMNNQVTVMQKGKKITVNWKKASAADGYYVYVQYCGKKYGMPVKTIENNSTTKVNITKINGKKINLKKQFKVVVKPYKIVNGKKVILAKSMTAHVVGVKNKKYTNVKSIKATKKALTVKVGKTKKAKAKITLVDKKKKHIPSSHAPKFRYRTSDKKIATVDKNGKIKGIKKGTCTIYVYAINGKMTKIKVTVK